MSCRSTQSAPQDFYKHLICLGKYFQIKNFSLENRLQELFSSKEAEIRKPGAAGQERPARCALVLRASRGGGGGALLPPMTPESLRAGRKGSPASAGTAPPTGRNENGEERTRAPGVVPVLGGRGRGAEEGRSPAPPATWGASARAPCPGPGPAAQRDPAATRPRTVTRAGDPAPSAAFRGAAEPKRTAERQPVKPRAAARRVSGSAPGGPADRRRRHGLGLRQGPAGHHHRVCRRCPRC